MTFRPRSSLPFQEPSYDCPSVRPSEPAPTRSQRRAAVGDRLLDALEEIVTRHRSLGPSATTDLHTELIAAEVAHQLALTRSALHRLPPLRAPE